MTRSNEMTYSAVSTFDWDEDFISRRTTSFFATVCRQGILESSLTSILLYISTSLPWRVARREILKKFPECGFRLQSNSASPMTERLNGSECRCHI